MFNSIRDQESLGAEEEKSLIEDIEDYFEPILEEGLGIITESVSTIIKRKRAPEVFSSRFEALFRSNQSEKIREIALNPTFTQENPEYVSSGELPYLALKFDETFLLKEIKAFGFSLTAKYFIRAIENSEARIISFIISESLYSESYLELVFWLMLKNNMNDQAKELLCAEEKLKTFFFGFLIGSKDSVELFLKTYEKIVLVMNQALLHKEDVIAANLLVQNPLLVNRECVKIAFDNGCIETLKIVWSGNVIDSQTTAHTRAKKSLV